TRRPMLRCRNARSASVQAVVVSRYTPAASGTNVATTTVKYGSTRARAADTDAAAPPRVASPRPVAVGRAGRAGVAARPLVEVPGDRGAGRPGGRDARPGGGRGSEAARQSG